MCRYDFISGKSPEIDVRAYLGYSAGYLMKLSDNGDWAKRWFVLNEKTCKVQNHDLSELSPQVMICLIRLASRCTS